MIDRTKMMSPVPEIHRELSLKTVSDPTTLAPARQAIEKFFADAGFDAKSCDEIGLAVNEALANVIRHVYANAGDRPIEITAKIVADEAIVQMRDWGKGVNPLELPPTPAACDPLKPGGLGLVCMRRMTDSLVFTRLPDGMLLTMKRRKTRA